jgi:hypothetical protein
LEYEDGGYPLPSHFVTIVNFDLFFSVEHLEACSKGCCRAFGVEIRYKERFYNLKLELEIIIASQAGTLKGSHVSPFGFK